MLFLVTERARHAATAAGDDMDTRPGNELQHFRRSPHTDK